MRAASAARSKWLERQKKGWTVYKYTCIVTSDYGCMLRTTKRGAPVIIGYLFSYQP